MIVLLLFQYPTFRLVFNSGGRTSCLSQSLSVPHFGHQHIGQKFQSVFLEFYTFFEINHQTCYLNVLRLLELFHHLSALLNYVSCPRLQKYRGSLTLGCLTIQPIAMADMFFLSAVLGLLSGGSNLDLGPVLNSPVISWSVSFGLSSPSLTLCSRSSSSSSSILFPLQSEIWIIPGHQLECWQDLSLIFFLQCFLIQLI